MAAIGYVLTRIATSALADAGVLQKPTANPLEVSIEIAVALLVGIVTLLIELAIPTLVARWIEASLIVCGAAGTGLSLWGITTAPPEVTGRTAPLVDGDYTFQSVVSPRDCLAITTKKLAGLEVYNVDLANCSSSRQTTWTIRHRDDGWIEFHHRATDSCLLVGYTGPRTSTSGLDAGSCSPHYAGMSLFANADGVTIASRSRCISSVKLPDGDFTARPDYVPRCDDRNARWVATPAHR